MDRAKDRSIDRSDDPKVAAYDILNEGLDLMSERPHDEAISHAPAPPRDVIFKDKRASKRRTTYSS